MDRWKVLFVKSVRFSKNAKEYCKNQLLRNQFSQGVWLQTSQNFTPNASINSKSKPKAKLFQSFGSVSC